MKKILTLALLTSSIIACKNNTSKLSPAQQLESLKKQKTEINEKIATLEEGLGAGQKKAAKLVSLLAITPVNFISYLDIQGKVDGGENVQVSPMAQGTLTAVYVRLGQKVTKGQALAKIDDNVLKQSIDEIQVQIDLANNLFQRQKNLWDQKVGTEVQYLNAKAQVDALKNKMGNIKTQLANYIVKAPVNGTIDQMDLKVGQAYSAGATGLRIVNDANVSLKAIVSESYIGKINAGDLVKVYFADATDTLNTKITYATKSIDPISRGFLVEIKLPSKSIYRPNMNANIKAIEYQKANSIVIPVNLVQKSESSSYVYVSKNNIAERVNVSLGKVSEGKAQILSGLNPGDSVINLGVLDINQGDLITVK